MPTCNAVTLKSGAACYLFGPLTPFQQKALIIYAKALELAAIGGADYTASLSTTLLSDANSATCGMDEANRIAARVNLALFYAAEAGATVPAALNTKMNAIRCLAEADQHALDEADLWLTCQLGTHAAQ